MIEALREWVRVQQYAPGALAPFVNPFYLARRSLWRGIRTHSAAIGGAVLDVGCGTQPYRSLFDAQRYVGLEVDSDVARQRGVADVYYDGARFPIDDESFDSVLCNQVLEHVFNPDEFVGELHRVLKPGGRLLLTVPFVWDEHEQPHDYARYSSFGLRALLERQGFHLLVQEKLMADASVLFQLINAWLYKLLLRRGRIMRWTLQLAALSVVSYLGRLSTILLPRNEDLFLDQLIIATKP